MPDLSHIATAAELDFPRSSEIPITLHKGVSDAFVGAVRGHIRQLPPEVQTLLAEGGWQVRVIKNATHDRAKFDTLEVPEIRATGSAASRGPKEILFFEYQLNPTARGDVKIVSALSGPSDFEYTVRHEFGHALDRQLGISASAEVTTAHTRDTSGMLPAVQDELHYFQGESGRAEVVADRLAERLQHWNAREKMRMTESWVSAHPSIDAAFDGAIKARATVSKSGQAPQRQQQQTGLDGRLKEIMTSFYRSARGDYGSLLFDGYVDTVHDFNAVAEQAQRLQAHGMRKFNPARETQNLIGFFTHGIDTSTDDERRGYLETGPLEVPNEIRAGAGAAFGTGGGTAYREGTYVLVARAGSSAASNGITSASDIAAVLVNQRLVNHAHDIIQELERILPKDVMVRPFADVAEVVAYAHGRASYTPWDRTSSKGLKFGDVKIEYDTYPGAGGPQNSAFLNGPEDQMESLKSALRSDGWEDGKHWQTAKSGGIMMMGSDAQPLIEFVRNWGLSSLRPPIEPAQIAQQVQQQQRRPEVMQAQRDFQAAAQLASGLRERMAKPGSGGSQWRQPVSPVVTASQGANQLHFLPRSDVETPEFYEVGRIVDPDSTEGKQFSSFMEGLRQKIMTSETLRKIIGGGFDTELNDPGLFEARYLLADENSPNAYTIPVSKPPVVVIHKGLLKDVKSLDELAGVLTHEWGHILAKRILNQENSKRQETLADNLAVRILAEAKMNAHALGDMLQRWDKNGKHDESTRLMAALFDVHPLSHNRADIMEGHTAAIEREHALVTRNPSTALPTEVLEVAESGGFSSRLTFEVAATRDGYDGKSLPDKMAWLQAQSDTLFAQLQQAKSDMQGDPRNPTAKMMAGHFAAQLAQQNSLEMQERFVTLKISSNPEEIRQYHQLLQDISDKHGLEFNSESLLKGIPSLRELAVAAGYDSLPPTEKLEWLLNTVEKQIQSTKDLPSWDSIQSNVIRLRSSEVTSLWQQVTIDPNDPQQAAAYHRAFDRLLATELPKLDPCYDRAVSVLYGSQVPERPKSGQPRILQPVGVLGELYDSVLAFAASKTPEEAGVLAERVYTLQESVRRSFSHSFFLDNKIIRRVLPSYVEIESMTSRGGLVEIPFLRQASMAKALQSGTVVQRQLSFTIEKGVSSLLGGHFQLSDTHERPSNDFNYQDIGMADILYPPREDASKSDRHYDEYVKRLIVHDGAVQAVVPEAVTIPVWNSRSGLSWPETLQVEADYMQRRATWEKGLLQQGVRWELLDSTPELFYKIYEAAMLPQRTLVSHAHPFAEALCERLRSMPEAQRKTILPTLVDAISNSPSNSAYRKESGVDPSHPYVSLIMEHSNWFRGWGELGRVRINALEPSLPLSINADQSRLFNDNLKSHKTMQGALHWAEIGRSDPVPHQVSMLVEWLANSHGHSRGQLKEGIAAINNLLVAHALEPIPADYVSNYKALSEHLVTAIGRIDLKSTNPDRFRAFLDTLVQPTWGLAEDHPLQSYKLDEVFLKLLRQHSEVYQYTGTGRIDKHSPHNEHILATTQAALLQHIEQAADSLLLQPLDVKMATFDESLRRSESDNNIKKLPKIREAILGGMLEDVSKIVSPQDRIAVLERVASYSRHFVTEAQHAQLAKLTVGALVGTLGRDDGTPAYQQRVESALAPFLETIQGSAKGKIIQDFAEESESQPTLTDALKNLWIRESDKEQRRSDQASGVVEALYEHLKHKTDSRADAIEFLIHPPTVENTDKVLAHLPQAATGLSGQDEFTKEAGRYKLREFHSNFWDASMPLRVTIMSGLLFDSDYSPAQARHVTQRLLDRVLGSHDAGAFSVHDLQNFGSVVRDSVDTVREAKDWAKKTDKIIEAFTPLKNKAKADLGRVAGKVGDAITHRKNDTNIGRLIVDAYLDTVAAHSPKEAQLLAAGLLAAEHARKPGQPLRMGQVLDKVLSHMGPAGYKLKQAIHSNPSTPADIREDLKGSKTHASEEPRWDYMDKLRAAGLLDPAKTTHVGPVKGIGSFGITGFNTAPDGVQYADTVLRSSAAAVAEREFNFMLKAAYIIADADPDLVPVIDMIREAQHSARIETRAGLAPKQNSVMEQVIDGVRGTVMGEDGVTYKFTHRVARLVEAGENYKRAEIAPGAHYLDLPLEVPQERAYRRASGLFMLATQITRRYAGMPMDQDRHGGNIKQNAAAKSTATTTGEVIHHFDHGMVELKLPNDEAKHALGKVTAQAVLDASRGGDFMDHLLKRIQRADVSGETRSFLAGFTREVLALGDYINEPGKDADGKPITVKAISDEQLAGVMGEALYGEHVDPVVKASYEKALGRIARPKVEEYFAAAREKLNVRLENVPSRETLQMPTLATEEKAIVDSKDHGLPHRLATQRMAIQSGAGNGIGVVMGAYGLWNKFNDKDGTFHEDMKSGDTVRQALAWTGLATDFANIGAGAVSTTVDAKTFQQAKVQAPAASAPASPVNAAPSSATAAPTGATSATPQASTPTATAAKATTPAAPAAPTTGSVQAPQAPTVAQAPTPPANAQAGGATSAASTAAAQQAEKAAAETAQAAAKAAEQAAKAEKLLKAGRIAGKVAIPLAVATGAVEASAGARAGDRERVAGAVGGTGGGIIGGMLVGAAAAAATGAVVGSAVPGIGTVVVGIVAGIGGGIAGAIAGEEAAKHWGSNLIGKLIGSDDKFLEAMKQLDAATQKQFAKSGGKLTLDDVHEILKGGKLDSVAHVDTSKDGILSGAELKAALEKARATFIDNQLTEQLSALEAKGWGKALGNKDGKLTLDELKASIQDKGIDLTTLIREDKITGKAITDALVAKAPTPTAPPAVIVAVAKDTNAHARR